MGKDRLPIKKCPDCLSEMIYYLDEDIFFCPICNRSIGISKIKYPKYTN